MVKKRQKVDDSLMIVAVVAVVAIVSLIINSADIINFSGEKIKKPDLIKKIDSRDFCGECSTLVSLSNACDAESECGGPCSEFDYLTVDSCVDFTDYWYMTQGSMFVFGPQWNDAAIESMSCGCCYYYDITYCGESGDGGSDWDWPGWPLGEGNYVCWTAGYGSYEYCANGCCNPSDEICNLAC